jgi:hypothetical protein
MAPKAAAPKRKLGKKAKVADVESHQKESAAAANTKKAKKEPMSEDEQTGKNITAGKQGLGKMYQVMKYMGQERESPTFWLYTNT